MLPIRLTTRGLQEISASATGSRLIHTTSQCAANVPGRTKAEKHQEKERRKFIAERKTYKKQHLEVTKPDAVLGHRNTEEGYKRWRNSELSQLLLNRDEVWGLNVDDTGKVTRTDDGELKLLNFDLDDGEEARKLLFDDLAAVMIDKEMYGAQTRAAKSALDAENLSNIFQEKQEREEMKIEHLRRILDMRNASSKDIHKENIRRIVKHFSIKSEDPGLCEVQAAVLTYRIRLMEFHLRQFRKDVGTINSLRKLVSKRTTILRYLKKLSQERYESFLPKIGMEKRAIEEQVHVLGQQTLLQIAERSKFPVF